MGVAAGDSADEENRTEKGAEIPVSKENPYNIDIKSTEPQAMSKKRAGAAILAETLKDYFGGLNFFAGSDKENLTYENVVAHIGIDPSEYRYDAERDIRIYSWYAAESEASVLNVWFKDGRLYACGAYNLGFPIM